MKKNEELRDDCEFVTNELTFIKTQEKDEETGEPLYEINVRALVGEKTKKSWEGLAKYFGCSLSHFVDQCLLRGEESALEYKHGCNRMGKIGEEWRAVF